MSKNNEELLIQIWLAASNYRTAQKIPDFAGTSHGLAFFEDALDIAIDNYEESE